MNENFKILAALGAGAGLMYWLDPMYGHRRRIRLGEGMAKATRQGLGAVDMVRRDLGHRVYGRAIELKSRLRPEEVEDDVLVQRVRAQLGRVVSHPGAIEVSADQGRVTLSGPILSKEAKRLCDEVRHVRGVREVVDRLRRHEHPGTEPALQEGGTPRSPRAGVLARGWTPSSRFFIGTASVGLLGAGLMRRGAAGTLSAIVGGALCARAAFNRPLAEIFGLRGDHGIVTISKTIHINQPLRQVYACWQDFSAFPRFMSHVRAVIPRGERRMHWVVDGPLGIPITWDAVVTKMEPNQLISWESEGGNLVRNAGSVSFEADGDERTRVQIHMTYNPIAGLIGHGIARLFGVDPKHQMDDDLIRMKSYLETGRPPHDAAVRSHRETVH